MQLIIAIFSSIPDEVLMSFHSTSMTPIKLFILESQLNFLKEYFTQIHPEMKTLSSFTHPYGVPNLYDFL